MLNFNVEINESIFSRSFFKSMKKIESRFEHLDLINKEKKNSIRVQIFEKIVVAVAAIKKYKRVKRKSRFSFDLSNFENITTQKNSLLQHSIIRQLNEVLNVQNVNINQIVERMNIMRTIFIKLTTINLRIKIKLNQNQRSDRHYRKKRTNSSKFEHFVDFQSFRNDRFKFISYIEFIIIDFKKKRFKTSNVDYFDSNLSNNYDKKNVITSNEKIIYRDVFFFVETIKFIAILMKYETTKIRLHRCFRDTTLK